MVKVFNMNEMDDKGKKDFWEYLEKVLVSQAVNQHKELCDKWTEGGVTEYWFEDEANGDRSLNIRYESGNVWCYEALDLGAEGMTYKLREDLKEGNEKECANEVANTDEKKRLLDALATAYADVMDAGINIININSSLMKFVDDETQTELGELGYSAEIKELTGQNIVEYETSSDVFGEDNSIEKFIEDVCKLLEIDVPTISTDTSHFQTKTTLAQYSPDDDVIYISDNIKDVNDFCFALAHELRHVWQIKENGDYYVAPYKPREMFKYVEEYNLQPAEIDSNAFAGLIMAVFFSVKPLYKGLSERVKEEIKRRTAELLEEYCVVED